MEHPNWPAFMVFLDCATQWRVITGGEDVVYQGIEYASLHAVMKMRKVKKTRKMLQKVRAIEAGAIAGRNGMSLEKLFNAT